MSPRPLFALVLAVAAATSAACSKSSAQQPSTGEGGASADPAGASTGSGRTVTRMRPPVHVGSAGDEPGDHLTVTAPGTADDPGAGPGDHERGIRDRMKPYDTDGDGRLSDDERYTMLASRASGILRRMDTNGDGQLSRAEFDASPGARRIGDFAAADTDHSGALSPDELGAAMVAQMKKAGGFRAWRGGPFGAPGTAGSPSQGPGPGSATPAPSSPDGSE